VTRGTARTTTKRDEKTVMKTFRLPQTLVEVLASDSRENNRTATEHLVWVLRNYAEFDRFAPKFGFVTLSRRTFKAIVDSLPEERLREIAITQSVRIGEFMEFWFKKKDLDTLLATIEIFSKHLRLMEYTMSRTDHELSLTMRTDLGKKAVLFAAVYWETGIAKTLGMSPKVEVGENQVTLRLPI
jgi:hypothetical protein